MTPRPRKRKNKDLPENLHPLVTPSGTYFRFRHPVTKKWHSLGKDKERAVIAAKRLNNILMPTNDLVARVANFESLKDHIEWFFKEIIVHRDYAPSTIEMYEVRSRQLKDALGHNPVSEVSVKDIANLMGQLSSRSAQQLRQVAVDIFKTAMGRGLIVVNPADLTNKPVSRKARKRLSMEQFQAVHQQAPVWLQNTMMLALYTLQRREDIVNMRFENIKGDRLFVIQQKTKKHDTGYLKIKIGSSLQKIINDCRDDLVSPYIVHRRPIKKIKSKHREHWTQISKNMVTRSFTEIVDSLECFKTMPKSERPTFHEIRALGERMYRKSGIDPMQIGGWASQKMVKNYDAGHDEIRWIEAESL